MSLTGVDTGAVAGAKQDRTANGRYRSKHADSRRDKAKRIKQRTAELIETYDASKPADLAVCALAACHLDDALHARSRISRVRSTNAARRLLSDLKRKPEPQPETLASYEARKRREASHG